MANRILHADDDLIFSRITKKILHQNGFEVYNAYDGEQAWMLFNEMSFHYCLLDIMMPRLNGIDLGERIRSVDRRMPIFYLSSEDPMSVEEDVFGRGGGNGYFAKTLSIRKLSIFLQHYFSSSSIIKPYDVSYRKNNI
ncbi:response regulator [Chitinophaga sp.]|uniref:response regulator n=1 Tax=Chitinophaga sp. TaxID=1869181 RepID=UPI002F953095